MKRLILSAILLSATWGAAAQNMQCGNKLISQGDSMSKVTAICGHPTQVDRSTIVRSVGASVINGQLLQSGGAQVEVAVEVWLYNLGPDKFMRQLRFEDGRVVKIDTLDYGYLEGS